MRALVHLSILSAALWGTPARAEPVTLKIAANVATNSAWHAELKKLATSWRDLSGGAVSLSIYVGGTMGDEGDIVKKLRLGQLDGAVLTSEGLHALAPEAVALDLPMVVADNAEYDALAGKVLPLADAALTTKGFVPLGWTHVGWLHLFSTQARPSLPAAKTSKLWLPSGDPALEAMVKVAGFLPLSLGFYDAIPALSTGQIDALPVAPSMALAYRIHDKARFMLDLPLASQSAALVVSQASWDKMSPTYKAKLEQSARALHARMTAQARALATSALAKMKAEGLTIVPAQDAAAWPAASAAMREAARDKWVPAATMDAVNAAIAAKRASKP